MNLYSYKTLIVTLLFAGLAVSGHALAEENAGTPAAETPRYLTPEEITSEDYDMMSEYAYRYDACLNQTAQEQMEKQQDPRHVVDYAMKQCAVELEELDRKMIARNFDPAYRQGYIGKVNRHAVNNTLRRVMVGMAGQQKEPPAEQTQ